MQDFVQSEEMKCTLVLPDDFADYAHEVEWKEWFGNARIRRGTDEIAVEFYTLNRFVHGVEPEIQRKGFSLMDGERFVLVPEVTEMAMQHFVMSSEVHSLFPEVNS
jgi:hypothetical protein